LDPNTPVSTVDQNVTQIPNNITDEDKAFWNEREKGKSGGKIERERRE
jgi:hypothetical protein